MQHLPVKSPDYEDNVKNKRSVLLLYSGGVDTSISLYLLKNYYGYRVKTLTVDVCQDRNWARDMAKKAKKLGAVKTIVYDGRSEYADNYASKLIKANAAYDDYYPLGTSIARPWQARVGLSIAKKEKVDAIAHGNKGRGAGAFQFNMVFNYFSKGDLKLVMPIGDWWPTREEEVEFAAEKNIPIPVLENNPYSYDDNIMSNAINYGDIDDIEKSVPESAYKWTNPLTKTPNKPEIIELEYKNGLPVSLNGKKMKLSDIIQKLNIVAGKHGIGRINMIENGLYGNKFKWVYEAPAASILIYCHKEIEKLVLPKESLTFKHNVIDKKWTQLVYHTFVYSPLTKALFAFIDELQMYVNGKITLELYKGNFTVVRRHAKESLVNIDTKSIKLKIGPDTIPYGFEEYSFALKHPHVFTDYLGKIK